jgi:hypothetical protein
MIHLMKLNKKVKLSRYRHAGAKEERAYSSYLFLTSALDGVDCQIHAREMNPVTRWIGGWVGLTAGMDTEARGKVLCFCQRPNPGHSVCRQILYCWLNSCF